ncbi:lysis protein (plasmid) [Arsenophonus nasoniae]|uniref:Lysis protein n=1 Tax=Arsenophonus nasoniae TaxID=638 RepID=A0A4P7L954_9GAMM|nr:lysis protein [Arsenophonus nasoniae]QBY46814.1 Bacteriophage Rz lysis protein [Arsenophonus nasoniae]WGM08895.1 lysis protein [Arsenophonus nasoniae]WGM13919.1 lysis protein [Arsenophonus nasoniae]WGM18214.1 lysis protein [Arsenophonus nasoniae]
MLWRHYAFVVAIIAALVLSLVFINARYQNVKQNYQTLKLQYHEQIEALKLQQKKLEALHQLDIQHTEELNNAKAEIAKLHDAVRAGTKRLRVNAVCRASKTTTAQSRYDDATTQFGASTRQDYFSLREMIVENENQTEYLQQYIKKQCQ